MTPEFKNYNPLVDSEQAKEALKYISETEPLNVDMYPVNEISKYDRSFHYKDLMEDDLYEQLSDHKADSQSTGAKLGNMAVRGLAKAAISMVEPFGNLLDIEQMTTDINEVEEEYGNWFNNWLIKQEENLDAAMPIYTKEEQPRIGSMDWFLKNGDQVIKSIGYFAPGMAFTKGAHMLFKGLQAANVIGKGLAATKAVSVLAPLASVVAMNYNEHMRSAVETFKSGKEQYYNKYFNEYSDKLKTLYDSGDLTEKEYNESLAEASKQANTQAKIDASKNAESVIKKGKMNIPFELIEYMTLFKYMGGSRSLDDVAAKALSVANAKPILADFLKSGASEYMQEVNTGYFEKEAERDITEKVNGAPLDETDAANRYLQHVASYEGLTEGLSGMIGGSGMQVLSTVMAQKSRNVARNVQKELAAINQDSKLFNSLERKDLLDLLQRASASGKAGSAIKTFEEFQKLTPEQATQLGFDENFQTKATEYKDIATEYEKGFNELSIMHQQNTTARDILLNRRMNNYLATKDIKNLEVKIDEIKSKYNKDQIDNPILAFKVLDAKLAGIDEALKTSDLLLNTLDEKYVQRTVETNETAEEIEERSALLHDARERLYKEKVDLLNKHLKSKYVKPDAPKTTTEGAEKVQPPEYKYGMHDGNMAIFTSNFDAQANEINKDIEKQLVVNSPTDSELIKDTANLEYLKSIRDSSFKGYQDFLNDPSKLKTVVNSLKAREKDKESEFLKVIDTADENKINELKKTLTSPTLVKALNNRTKKLESEAADIAKRKKDIEKAKAKANVPTGTTTTTGTPTQADPVVVKPPAVAITWETITGPNDILTGENLIKATENVASIELPVLTMEDVYNLPFEQIKKYRDDYVKVVAVNRSLHQQLMTDGKFEEGTKIKEVFEKQLADSMALNLEYDNRVTNNERGNVTDAKINPQILENDNEYIKASKLIAHSFILKPNEETLSKLSPEQLEEQLGIINLAKSYTMTDTVKSIKNLVDDGSVDIAATEAKLRENEAIKLAQYDINKSIVESFINASNVHSAPAVNDVRSTPVFRPEHNVESASDPNMARLLFARTNKNRILNEPIIKRFGQPDKHRDMFKGNLINSATSAAYLDLNYITLNDAVDRNGKPVKETIDNQLIIRNSMLKFAEKDPNLKLNFVVDEESKTYKELVATFGLNSPEVIENAPIKIQAVVDGKLVDTDMFVHETKWVQNNTQEVVQTDDDVIDNLAIQEATIKKMRNAIFEAKKNNTPIQGHINSVSKGHAQFNIKYENTKLGIRPVIGTNLRPVLESLPLSQALPGLTRFAIKDNTFFKVDNNNIINEGDIDSILSNEEVNGMLFGEYIDPRTNKSVMIPISSKLLGDKELAPVKKGVVNAIRNYFSSTPSPDLGFSHSNFQTLTDYLDDLIYLSSPQFKPTTKSQVARYGNSLIVAEEADSEAGIVYGIEMTGTLPMFSKYLNGNKSTMATGTKAIEMFEAKLTRVVNNTPLSVKLNRINSDVEFKIPTLTESGKLATGSNAISYPTYNDFLKNSLTTIFNGRFKLDTGEYTMFVQNNIDFGIDNVVDNVVQEEQVIVDEKTGETSIDFGFGKDIEDAINNDEYLHSAPNVEGVNYNIPFEMTDTNDNILPQFKDNFTEQFQFVNNIASAIISHSLDSIYIRATETNLNKSLDYIRTDDNAKFDALTKIKQYGYEAALTNPQAVRIMNNLNISSQADLDTRYEAYVRFMANWDALARIALSNLEDANLISGELHDNLDDENNFAERVQYDSKLRMQVDPKSYSNKLRVRLNAIQELQLETNEDGTVTFKPIINALGRPIYADGEVLYNTILELLADTTITLGVSDNNASTNVKEYIDNAIGILEQNSLIYPTLKNVIGLLTNPTGIISSVNSDTTLTSEAKKAKLDKMRKDYLQSTRTIFTNATLNTKIRLYKNVVYKKGEVVTIKSIPINEVGGYKGVVTNWIAQQKLLGLFKPEGSKLKVDTNQILAVKQELDNLLIDTANNPKNRTDFSVYTSDEFLSKVAAIFGKLGILQADKSNIDNESLIDWAKYNSRAANVQRKDVGRWMKLQLTTAAVNPTSKSLMDSLFNHLLSPHLSIDIETDNIFQSGDLFAKFVKPLAEAVYRNNDINYSLVSIDSDNNILYEVQKYNALMSMLRDIKNPKSKQLEAMASTSLTKTNPLIRQLRENHVVRSNFDIVFYDSTVDRSTQDGKVRTNTEDRNNQSIYLQTRASFLTYQASISTASVQNYNFAKYLGLTLGDNPISFIMNSIRTPYQYKYVDRYTESGEIMPIDRFSDLVDRAELPDSAVNNVFTRVMGEVNRIKEFNKLKKEGKVFKNKDYNKFGDRFVKFSFLNYNNISTYLTPEEINEVYLVTERSEADINNNVPKYDISNSPKADVYLKKAIRLHLENALNEMEQDFVENGIIKTRQGSNLYTSDSINTELIKITGEQIADILKPYHYNFSIAEKRHLAVKTAILDYFINTYIANSDMYDIFAKDLAHYAKEYHKDMVGYNPKIHKGEIDYNATNDAIQKRLRQLVTPYITGNYIKDTSKTITINDIKIASEIKELQQLGYIDTNIADGFELATMEEGLYDMLAYDLIEQSKFDKALARVTKNKGKYYRLDNLGINSIQVAKPISWDSITAIQDDTIYPHRVKSSRFYLDPVITKDFPELDKLRVFMESKGIDRAPFDSAVKIKANQVLQVFDENGKFRDDIVQEYDNNVDNYLVVQTYDNTGYNVINPHSKTKISNVIQVDRGLFTGIRDFKNFKYRVYNNGKYETKSFTGRELELLKEGIRKKQLDLGKEALIKEFDITIEKGKLTFNNLEKLKEIIQREGESRKWISNSIKLLSLTNDNKFELPLVMNDNLSRIESVIFSLINKSLVRHKISGGSWIQIPNLGTSKTIVTTTDNINQDIKDSIIYVDTYSPSNKLQFLTKGIDGVKRAQIIVSWNFRDVNGELLPIENFTYEKAGKLYLDYEKIPKEILDGIGMRIPNQKHSSMLPFEIVGFLPERYKDTVIVPNEIVTQMGSDFDIDKLYSYLYDYYYDRVKDKLVIIRRNDPRIFNSEERVKEINKELKEIKELRKETKKLLDSYKDDIEFKKKAEKEVKRLNSILNNLDESSDDYTLYTEQLAKLTEILNDNVFQKNTRSDISEFAINFLRNTDKIKALNEERVIIKNKLKEATFLNNEYIDIHNSVLTHPEVYDKIAAALDLQDLADEVSKLRKASTQDILNPKYQIESYMSQQAGKGLLSMISLHQSFHGLVEGVSDNKYRTDKTSAESMYLISVENVQGSRIETQEFINIFTDLKLSYLSGLGRHTYTDRKGNIHHRDNQDTITILQNAAVDNANTPLLGFANLNDVTINAALMLAYLKDINGNSVGIPEIVRFINQPIIKRYVQLVYKYMNDSESNTSIHEAKKDALDTLYDEYNKRDTLNPNGKITSVTIDFGAEELKDKLKESFTADELSEMIDSMDDSDAYRYAQIKILDTLTELDRYFQDLDNVRKAILTPSKSGLGKNYAGVLYQKLLIDKYLSQDSNVIRNLRKVYRQSNGELTQAGYFTNESINVFGEGIGRMFGYETGVLKQFLDSVVATKDIKDINAETYNRALKFYRKVIYATNSSLYDENVIALRNRLLKGDASLGKRIAEVQNILVNPAHELYNDYQDLYNNKFLKAITVQPNVGNNNIDTIKHAFMSKVGINPEANNIGLSQLLSHKSKAIRDIGIDLVKYTFVMGQPTTANYQQDIAYKYLKDVGFLRGVSEVSEQANAAFLTKLYIQHFPFEALRVYKSTMERALSKSSDSFKYRDSSIGVYTEFRIPTYETARDRFYYILKGNRFDLYERVSVELTPNGKIGKYVKIPVLGGINSKGLYFMEGDVNNPSMNSMIEINNIGVGPAPIANTGSLLPAQTNKYTQFSKDFLNNTPISNINTALSNVRINTPMVVLANYISNIVRTNGFNITIEEDNTIRDLGTYRDGKIKINTERIGIDKAKQEAIIVHEALHGITSKKFELYNRGELDKLTSSEKGAIRKFEELRLYTIEKVKDNPNYEANEQAINDYFNSQTGTINKEQSVQYALRNNHEFLTAILTNRDAQEFLNNITYTDKKTLLTELKELLSKLVQNFIKALGIEINNNNVLKEGIIQSINLLDTLQVQLFEDVEVLEDVKVSEDNITTDNNTNEFTIADNLPPIEQNFTDGQGGRTMQPQFKGKSTMDLIKSGDRTRTTRAKTDINRMIKDYNLIKIENLVGKVIRMTDRKGNQVYTRVTNVAKFTQSYQDQTWQKEGWTKDVTDRHVGDYPYAIEFEVVNKTSNTGFQGYKGGFENKGKGTPEGDGKDKAMRQVADSFIGEEYGFRSPSSTRTSAEYIHKYNSDNNLENEASLKPYYSIANQVNTLNIDNYTDSVNSIVMLARNGSLANTKLHYHTKDAILKAHNNGAEFIVGDMPNVDSQFIDYLQEIGAKFTIYHTGSKPRININPTQSNQLEIPYAAPNVRFDVYDQYNNPKINGSFKDIQYQLPENREINEFVASEKTIRDVAARMSSRIGIPVKFESDRTKRYKGKIEYDTAYINLAYATLDTPIHEILGHPIIKAIKGEVIIPDFKYDVTVNNNPDAPGKYQIVSYDIDGYGDIDFFNTEDELNIFIANKKKPYSTRSNNTLYQNLLKELEYGKGKEVLESTKRKYDYKIIRGSNPIKTVAYHQSKLDEYLNNGYILDDDQSTIGKRPRRPATHGEPLLDKPVYLIKPGTPDTSIPYTIEEQQTEAIVELLGLYTAERLDKIKDGNLISLLKELLKEIKNFVKHLILQKEIEIDKLPDNMTLGDIADILAYSNSNLILPGYQVIYTTPDNIQFKTYTEASNHITKLAKNSETVDLDNINLNDQRDEIAISKLEKQKVDIQTKIDNFIPVRKEFNDDVDIYLNEDPLKDVLSKDDNKYDYIRLRPNYWAGENGYTADSPKTLTDPDYHGFVIHYYNTAYNNDSEVIKISDEKAKEIFNTDSSIDSWTDTSLNIYKSLHRDLDKLDINISKLQTSHIDSFLDRNKQYEQSKEIIEEWKRVNNIKYNPDEVYSRGQEFVSVVGAYSSFDINLMMQNLLQHIEDNEKAGGKFAISAFTKPIDKKIGHLEGIGSKIKFKIYPQPNDILWAANIDVFSGSVWDASEKLNSDKKSELLGVSYTKYPSLSAISSVQPNLAYIIDDLAHHHNELGIVLTSSNFRLEYGDNIPNQTKKIINSINSILDQKYGKLIKPKIDKKNPIGYVTNIEDIPVTEFSYYTYDDALYYRKESDGNWYMALSKDEYDKGNKNNNPERVNYVIDRYNISLGTKTLGIQPTQTNETLKENIETLKNDIINKANNVLYMKRIRDAKALLHDYEYTAVRMLENIQRSKNIPKEPTTSYIHSVIKKYKIEGSSNEWHHRDTYNNETKEYTDRWNTFKVPDYVYNEALNDAIKRHLDFWKDQDLDIISHNENIEKLKEDIEILEDNIPEVKVYTDQALINTKIAKLKQAIKTYPRSLIRSEVTPIKSNPNEGYYLDDIEWQKLSEPTLAAPAVASENSNKLFTPISRTVSNINLRIGNLRSFNTRNTDITTSRNIEMKIEQLKHDINDLVNKSFGNNPDTLQRIALEQLGRAEAILMQDTITGNDLKHASDTISIWQFDNAKSFMTEEMLNNKESEFYQAFEQIGLEAQRLQIQLQKVQKQFADNRVSEQLGKNRKDKDIGVLEELGIARAYTLSASMSNADITMTVDSMLKLAKRNQIPILNTLFDQIDTVFAPLRRNRALQNLIGNNYDLFWQKDEAGKTTGRHTYMFSAKWDRMIEADENTKFNNYIQFTKGNISADTYYKIAGKVKTEMSKNSILLDFRFLIPGSTMKSDLKGYKFNNASEYRQHLVTVLGKDFADMFENQAKAKYTEYINAKAAYTRDIMEDHTIQDKEVHINNWDMKYNPIRVMDYNMGNVNDEPRMDRSEKYLVRVPRKFIAGKETGFYDKNFETIMNNTELSKFYEGYGTLMETLKNMLPTNVSDSLPANFLARVHKELLEKLAGLDLRNQAEEVLKHTFDFTTDVVGLNAQSESLRSLRDPKTGEIEKLPQLKYISKFDQDVHSKDLERIIRLFAMQAVNYDYMIKVRNSVEALYAFAESTVSLERSENTGLPTKGVGGVLNTIKQGKGTKQQLELLRYTIDALMYDKRINKPTPGDKVMFNGSAVVDSLAEEIEGIKSTISGQEFKFKDQIKKYEMAKEIELLRDELDFKLEDDIANATSDNQIKDLKAEYTRRMSRLEKKYKELGGRKLVYSNIGNFLINLTQLKGMGYNLTAGVANLTFGIMADMNHAAGNVEYGYKEFLQAFWLFTKSNKEVINKYYNIVKRFDILFEQVDSRYDKEYTGPKTKKLKILDPYIIQNKTEYVNQSLSLIATMLKTKITLADGKVVSLYEAFDDMGNIRYDILTEEDRVKWSTKLEATTKNDYTRFRDRAIQLNTYLHGNYDPMSPILIKKSMLGRMLTMFRSWIPMGFASRFLEDRYDDQLGRNIKGRYVTYHDLGMRSFGILLRRLLVLNPAFDTEMAAKGLSATDIENMKKNFSEIIMVAAVNALMALLKASIEDDDEEKGVYDYTMMALVNQIYRAEQDIYFYINPSTFYEIIKDPIPVTKTVQDLERAVRGTYRYYTEDDYRGQPPYVKWAKVFPFINQIPKFAYMATTDLKEMN
jgi:hypothetical protein